MEIIVGTIAAATVRLTALIIGYLVVRLGYTTMMAGVKGEFKFTSSAAENSQTGWKLGLESATPGLLFVLLGTALGAWGLFIDKPLGVDFHTTNNLSEQTPFHSTHLKPLRTLTCDPITLEGCDELDQ